MRPATCWKHCLKIKKFKSEMIGHNDRRKWPLTGHTKFLNGQWPMTGCYFEPWNWTPKYNCQTEKLEQLETPSTLTLANYNIIWCSFCHFIMNKLWINYECIMKLFLYKAYKNVMIWKVTLPQKNPPVLTDKNLITTGALIKGYMIFISFQT